MTIDIEDTLAASCISQCAAFNNEQISLNKGSYTTEMNVLSIINLDDWSFEFEAIIYIWHFDIVKNKD